MTKTALTGSIALACVVLLGTTACGQAKLTANSTCRQYLSVRQQDRYDQLIQIEMQLKVAEAGSPMWGMNTDYTCGSSPDMTLHQALGK